jgi:hypothetical protein
VDDPTTSEAAANPIEQANPIMAGAYDRVDRFDHFDFFNSDIFDF